MVNLELHLGVIQNVNVENRTIDIVDISKSNVTSVNYQNVYFADILENQIIPQIGYTVLFLTVSAVPGTEALVMPIRYYSSVLNGDEQDSLKSLYKDALQVPGDQVSASTGGTSVSVIEQAVIINAGSQTIKLDKNNSQTVIKYDSLVINGADGFKITQEQGSNTMTISKGNTTITLDDDQVTINTPTINVQGKQVNMENTAQPDGKGSFCALPQCLFTGATHIGSVAQSQEE